MSAFSPITTSCSICGGSQIVGKGSGFNVEGRDFDLCPNCGLYCRPDEINNCPSFSEHFDSLANARAHPAAWVVIATDFGSVPLMSCPSHLVLCNDLALMRLAADLDEIDAGPFGSKDHWDCCVALPVLDHPINVGHRLDIQDELWLNPELAARCYSEVGQILRAEIENLDLTTLKGR
ncbi:MAG: hypothetical protein JWM90_3062 [Thermoleophilia bacterium]|nr:hypothetical protein [Thermoleophilia bacterium]